MSTVREQFADRLHRWALDASEEEIRRGFPLVRSMKKPRAVRYLHFMSKLPIEERISLTHTLIKRYVGAIKGDMNILTPTEERKCRRCFDQLLVPLPGELVPLEKRILHEINRRFNKKLFERLIRKELERVLGCEAEDWGNGLWRYCNNVSGWRVITFVSVGGRTDLSYRHSICAGQEVVLAPNFCLLSCLGMPVVPMWTDLKDLDCLDVTEVVCKLCLLFVGAAHEWLRGLSADECQMSETGRVVDGATVRFANGAIVKFEYPIGRVFPFGDTLVVMLNIPETAEYNQNVLGLTRGGAVAWQVEERVSERSTPYRVIARYKDLVALGDSLDDYQGEMLCFDSASGRFVRKIVVKQLLKVGSRD